MTISSSRAWAVSALLAASLAALLAGQRTNPSGYFFDEASISYNALMMARHGVDENAVRFPLFFRSNPVYLYTLAAVFRVVPPSDVVGRHLSAVLEWLTAVIGGWLAWRISGRAWIALVSFLTLLVTPMLFDISRLVLEAAMYPFAVVVFLAAAHEASRRERWGAGIVAALAVTLILLTYTYSIGRLFGPMMAAGLLCFATRRRAGGLIAVLLLYGAAAAAPFILYRGVAADPLMARYDALRSYSRHHGWERISTVADYLIDNLDPIAMATEGDGNPRHHVQGSGGSILVMTVLLAMIGGVIVLALRRDRWWMFVVYGTFASYVPLSLTYDVRHALRSTPIPIFLVLLSIPLLELLESRPRLAAAFLATGVIQSIWFFSVFLTAGPRRAPLDGGLEGMVLEAMAMPQRPIYTVGAEPYAYACWYGTLAGVPRSAFVRVDAAAQVPPGAVAITNESGWHVRRLRSSDRSR